MYVQCCCEYVNTKKLHNGTCMFFSQLSKHQKIFVSPHKRKLLNVHTCEHDVIMWVCLSAWAGGCAWFTHWCTTSSVPFHCSSNIAAGFLKEIWIYTTKKSKKGALEWSGVWVCISVQRNYFFHIDYNLQFLLVYCLHQLVVIFIHLCTAAGVVQWSDMYSMCVSGYTHTYFR